MFLVLFCGFWTVDTALVTTSGSVVASRDLGTQAFLIKISGSEVHHPRSPGKRSGKYPEGVEFTFLSVKAAGGSGE